MVGFRQHGKMLLKQIPAFIAEMNGFVTGLHRYWPQESTQSLGTHPSLLEQSGKVSIRKKLLLQQGFSWMNMVFHFHFAMRKPAEMSGRIYVSETRMHFHTPLILTLFQL